MPNQKNYLKKLWKLLENADLSFFLLSTVLTGAMVFTTSTQEHSQFYL